MKWAALEAVFTPNSRLPASLVCTRFELDTLFHFSADSVHEGKTKKATGSDETQDWQIFMFVFHGSRVDLQGQPFERTRVQFVLFVPAV